MPTQSRLIDCQQNAMVAAFALAQAHQRRAAAQRQKRLMAFEFVDRKQHEHRDRTRGAFEILPIKRRSTQHPFNRFVPEPG